MLKLNILFIIATVITTLLMRHEVRRYTDARLAGAVADFERRRFTRRMVGVIIMALVLIMTYFGYTNKEAFLGHLWFFAVYWTSIIFMALSLIVIALIDVRAMLQYNLKNYLDENEESARLEKYLAKENDKAERKSS